MDEKINDYGTYTPTYKELEQRVKKLEKQALEHKEAEEKLRRNVAEVERSNEELKRFAYAASHDLQESLDVVSRYLRFVEARYKGRLDSDANEFIASAVDGANRLQSVINDLMAYLRRKGRAGNDGANRKSEHIPRSLLRGASMEVITDHRYFLQRLDQPLLGGDGRCEHIGVRNETE